MIAALGMLCTMDHRSMFCRSGSMSGLFGLNDSLPQVGHCLGAHAVMPEDCKHQSRKTNNDANMAAMRADTAFAHLLRPDNHDLGNSTFNASRMAMPEAYDLKASSSRFTDAFHPFVDKIAVRMGIGFDQGQILLMRCSSFADALFPETVSNNLHKSGSGLHLTPKSLLGSFSRMAENNQFIRK